MRTISCQWWEGDSVGTVDKALLSWVTFDPDKTYTVQVTIKANPGASFANSAGVAIGNWGEHFTVPDGKITRTGKDTLTFTATPIRQIDLTMPAPLTIGDPLPTIERVGGVPEGVTKQALDWPFISGNTVPEPEHGTVRAALTLKTDGTRPILVDKDKYLTVNGEEYVYASNGYGNNIVTDGSMVKVNIDLPVKAKGVSVRGTVTSYGSDSDDVTVTLTPSGGGTPFTDTVTGASGSAPYSQTYSFAAVPAGTYTLKVEKKNHVTREYEITVGNEAVIQDVKIHLRGDINGDGKLTVADYGKVLRHAKGLEMLTGYEFQCGDINGDGKLTVADYGKILRHAKMLEYLW